MAELVVMTWNVQNLLPLGSVGGPTSIVEYQAKLSALAAVVDTVGPDVLAVQEIGDDRVVGDLDTACGNRFPHRLTGSPDGRGIRVALLSAYPLTNGRDVTKFPPGVLPVQVRDITFDPPTTSTSSRGILSATVTIDDVDVRVITCHLKSKLISYPRAGDTPASSTFSPRDEGERLRYAGYALNRRTAEAMTCRQLLDELLTADGDTIGEGPGTGRDVGVVFCGDLNDEPLAATSQIIQGPGGSEIEFRPNSGFQSPDQGDGWRMWNLYPLLPAPAYTRIYRGRGELIDHIYASHRLVNPTNLPTIEIVAATPLPSVTDEPDNVEPSDHAAVVATFTL